LRAAKFAAVGLPPRTQLLKNPASEVNGAKESEYDARNVKIRPRLGSSRTTGTESPNGIDPCG
jgi:hypothetical protein